MKVKEICLWIISSVVCLSTTSLNGVVGGMVYRSETLTEGDRLITSKNYPKPYPPNLNFTWLCSSTTLKWAVVFLDFQLDAPTRNFKEDDWLELDDGHKPLRYSSSSQPHWPYKSSGHYLRITFITDSISGGKAQGFKIKLLHGKDDQEIAIKIHEANTAQSEQYDDDGDSRLLLIIVTVIIAILFIAIVMATLLCFLYHRRANSRDITRTDRDAFGVRRNSGVYHSRNPDPRSREQHTSEVVIVTRQTHRIPPEGQQSSQSAPVQRSNSQRDWRTRAELCAMVTVSSQNSRPNMYSHSGPDPQACGGREPDKVPDFNSFDDCCKRSRKTSKGGECNNDGCSTARKCNPHQCNTNSNSGAQNPSSNQSACASLSKAAAEKKCNNNDYTNIHFSKDTTSNFTTQDAGSQEPGSPVYCNSPVSSPTSPGLRDGLWLDVSVGSLNTGPASPTGNCYENVSACENQERLDKSLQTASLYMNGLDNTQVKRKNSYEVSCQRTTQEGELKAMAKKQGDSKSFRSDGLENILEVKRNSPPSVNLYSNWENIQKENKEFCMSALHETETFTDNPSSPSSDTRHNDTGHEFLNPCVVMQKPEEKRKERKISDPNNKPNVYQMNTKVPRPNTLSCSTDVKSINVSQDMNHSIPCNKEHERKTSSSKLTPQFSLELPAVNTGEYLYLTEFGISPHKPEKDWEKKDVADAHQLCPRVPKLSSSQSVTSDEGEYHLIPSSQERVKNEASANAMVLPFNAVLPRTNNISPFSPDSNVNDSGEYHLLPFNNSKSSHKVENAAGEVSTNKSMDATELQLNAKVPKPHNGSLSSPANSGEYHFLPSSLNNPRPFKEKELNMKISAPSSSFPPPEMKDNSNEGEYHYLIPCSKNPKNSQTCQEAEVPTYELGTAVPKGSCPSAVESPDDYYVFPKTNRVDINGQNGDVKFPDSGEYQLTSEVSRSKISSDDNVDNGGEYHYVVTCRNDEQDTKQKVKAEKTEMSKVNTYQLNVQVPKSSNALTTNDDGEYHLVPIRN